MSTTTGDQSSWRTSVIIWGIAGFLNVAIALLFVNTESLHTRSITYDKASIDEKIKVAHQRSEEKARIEEARRDQIRIPEADAKALRQLEELKYREQMLEHITELKENYHLMKEIESEYLSELEQDTIRRADAVNAHRLKELMGRTVGNVHRLQREIDKSDVVDDATVESLGMRLNQIDKQAQKAQNASIKLDRDPNDQVAQATSAQESIALIEKADKLLVETQDIAASSQGIAEVRERFDENIKKIREIAETMMDPDGSSRGKELAQTPHSADHSELDDEIENVSDMDTSDLYQVATKLEEAINQLYGNARTASLAIKSKKNFSEARENQVSFDQEDRPDFSEEIRENTAETVGDFNRLKEVMGNAVAEVENMRANARSKVSQINPDSKSQRGIDLTTRFPESAAKAQLKQRNLRQVVKAAGNRPVDLTEVMKASLGSSNSSVENVDEPPTPKGLPELSISNETIIAKALPGRRFTEDASRKGWLYVDTWYVIGPWSLDKYQGVQLQPEVEINLDAVYFNGMSGNPRKARNPSANLELDGKLKWRFHQSDMLFVRPPDEVGDAIYYAYTELYFDKQRDILIAVGIDDYSKVWINDSLVWSSRAESWELSKSLRKVTFQEGYNTVLIRMENGAPLMDFSLVLCPVNAS